MLIVMPSELRKKTADVPASIAVVLLASVVENQSQVFIITVFK